MSATRQVPPAAPVRPPRSARARLTGVGWVASAVAVVAVFVLLGALAGAIAPTPAGPPGSMYATAPQGLAAYAELLARSGRRVQPLRAPLTRAALAPAATLAVVDAGALSTGDTERLRAFVRAGGTLLLAGGSVGAAASAVLAGAPRWQAVGAGPARATAAFARASGVSAVLSAGPGSWPATPGVIERPGGGALLVLRALGRGRVELLADASPLENELLGGADNAALGLVLAGSPRQPVLFAEALHGYGVATGLAALPSRWWVALGGLAAAGGLWALARGRRLGPPQPEAGNPPPARSDYLEALATALVRSRDREGLADLARSAGVTPPDAGPRAAPAAPAARAASVAPAAARAANLPGRGAPRPPSPAAPEAHPAEPAAGEETQA